MRTENSPLLRRKTTADSDSAHRRNNSDGALRRNTGNIIISTTPSYESPTIDTGLDRHQRSSVVAIAAAQAMRHDRDSRRLTQQFTQQQVDSIPKPLFRFDSIDSYEADEAARERLAAARDGTSANDDDRYSFLGIIHQFISQLPAVIITAGLNFMVGIPFGASYFPTELQLEGKEVLGLRMFLFSTMVAQFVYTFASKFDSAVGLQMVENVPFCLELARIVMSEQSGNASGAVSTLFFLFGCSSLIVGSVFYFLGRLKLGRIVYFFPSHVLVGCIGGIGAFIIVTAIEVSTNTTFTFTAQGINDSLVGQFNLLLPVMIFESVLRILIYATKGKYPLLSPVYYCFITPIFYFILYCFGIDIDVAEEDGYFFPPINSAGSALSWSLVDIFTEVHILNVSWKAVLKAIPTMISLTAFSLIHVPINIPAFGVSTNCEPDMNAELIAHGYSNFIAGLFGGLQNYLAYSNSVIYSKAHGKGKLSSLSIVVLTGGIFVYGPMAASFVPRCMAGTILLHVGIELFFEGVVESYKDYDRLEYSGIILITITMITLGMDAALIAGLIAALSTFAIQSVTHQHPVKGAMSADTLRSSAWNRSEAAQKILLCKKKGRERIYVIQLQGHIFFGNSTILRESVEKLLTEKRSVGRNPIAVILDFSHVLGLDSSSAMTIKKLKDSIIKTGIEIVIFVSGHEDGFRCSYDLSVKVIDNAPNKRTASDSKRLLDPIDIDIDADDPILFETYDAITQLDSLRARSSHTARALDLSTGHSGYKNDLMATIPNCHVCETLDDALIFAEDVLVALQDPLILQQDVDDRFRSNILEGSGMTVRSSRSLASHPVSKTAKFFLKSLTGASESDIDKLYQQLELETYYYNDVVWKQGDESESLKLIIDGSLLSLLEDEDGARETCHPGSTIGELGLVSGTRRLTTVKVTSEKAILYSLSKEKWEILTQEDPKLARYIDCIAIRYLSHRIQHVSNSNLFGKRSLPV